MTLEVCILAGGLSTRMGRNKARLRIKGRPMVSVIRSIARELGFPVRVIRRDLVSRCGPLGGVITALKTTHAEAVLFLACDMPLVSAPLLRKVIRQARRAPNVVFVSQRSRVGFPFLLPAAVLDTIEAQVARRAFSIHGLAEVLHPRLVRVPARSHQLFNVNTPDDLVRARELLRSKRKSS